MKENSEKSVLPSSFRDPSGHLYYQNGTLYRQINPIYFRDFEACKTSGLYAELIQKELLIPHQEVDGTSLDSIKCKTIQPVPIPFISYPYEWSFSQLKDAALLTLSIQEISLEKGLSLKDASAYNIQMYKGKPIFIDSLSFERGGAVTVMALGLIHHLAISNNVPLPKLAEFFSTIADWLIVEFVPKSDSQVKKLLLAREDVFPDYRQDFFEKDLSTYFSLERKEHIEGSERTLYLFRRKSKP